MEQNSGRIDPTPRPPRSPPASFSRGAGGPRSRSHRQTWTYTPVEARRRTRGLPAAFAGSTANPRSRARTCWPKRSPPTSGANPGPESAGRLRPETPEQPKCRNGGRIHRASSIAIPRLPDRNPQTPTTIQYPLPRRGNRLVTLGVAAASPRARRRVARTAYKSLNARLMLK